MKSIYEIYPIGVPQLGVSYKGYSTYNEILRNKINAIINNERTAWMDFIAATTNECNINFFDMNYLQFPCHLGKYEIVNESSLEFDFKRTLVVNLSLLCNFYTIYFEDSYIYKSYTDSIVKPQVSMLFSKQNKKKVVDNNLCNIIEKNLHLSFPEYEYVSHKVLFEHKVKGAHPYTEGELYDEYLYSIYQLLFNSFYKEAFYYLLD